MSRRSLSLDPFSQGLDVSRRAVAAAAAAFPLEAWPSRPTFDVADVLMPGALDTFRLHGGVDLILCRLLMLHLSAPQNLVALAALEAAHPRILALSTFFVSLAVGDGGGGVIEDLDEVDEGLNNLDFPLYLGNPVDLTRAPYCLRAPDRVFAEGKDERGAHLGVWDVHRFGPLKQFLFPGDIARGCTYTSPR